jgi:hypothetical protein
MKNLKAELLRLGWTDTKALNTLVEYRLISDHCVTLQDIAEPDLTRAVKWLKTVD